MVDGIKLTNAAIMLYLDDDGSGDTSVHIELSRKQYESIPLPEKSTEIMPGEFSEPFKLLTATQIGLNQKPKSVYVRFSVKRKLHGNS